MVGSMPHTRMIDAEGNEQLVPLRIVDRTRRYNKDGSWRTYRVYEVSCFRRNFTHMQRLFQVKETSINHGESTRFHPTDSQQVLGLCGRRNATESWHAELKRKRRFLPVRGMIMQSFYLFCMIATQNARNIERMKCSVAPPGANAT